MALIPDARTAERNPPRAVCNGQAAQSLECIEGGPKGVPLFLLDVTASNLPEQHGFSLRIAN